jgi:hypothetical protein
MLPNTVNGFELKNSTGDTFLYRNDDADVDVSAATAPDGSDGTVWVVSVVAPGSAGGTIAQGLSGKSEAKKVAVDYMQGFPTDGGGDAGGSDVGMMDDTMNGGGACCPGRARPASASRRRPPTQPAARSIRQTTTVTGRHSAGCSTSPTVPVTGRVRWSG